MQAAHPEQMATWWAALVFAAIFLWGHRVRLLNRIGVDQRVVVSLGAGMSAAYVFVHVMPELSVLRREFVDSISMSLHFEGMVIYFVALMGFLFFYAIGYWRMKVAESGAGHAAGLRIHIGGFAVYVGLISYVVVDLPEHAHVSIVLYVVAMSLHFLSIDHALCEEHEEAYETRGRYVMAATAVAGWCIGWAAAPPVQVEALLLAFVSGGVMVNSMVAELSSSEHGRIVPFVLGSLLYGLVLVPLG